MRLHCALILPEASNTERKKWYQGLKNVAPSTLRSLSREVPTTFNPSFNPSFGGGESTALTPLTPAGFSSSSNLHPLAELAELAQQCSKIKPYEFKDPASQTENKVLGFDRVLIPVTKTTVDLGGECKGKRCDFEIPTIRGVPLTHGARIVIWAKSSTGLPVMSEMTLYMFGTKHYPEIQTNVAAVMKTIFDAMQTLCKQTTLNVFVEESLALLQKSGAKTMTQLSSQDPVLDAVLSETTANLDLLENRLFLHAVDIRKRGHFIPENFQPQTVREFRKIQESLLKAFSHLVKRVNFSELPLLQKQLARSERDAQFISGLQKIYQQYLCAQDIPYMITEDVESFSHLRFNPESSYFWATLRKFVSTLNRLQDFTFLVLDMYVVYRLFRTFPKAPTGLSNVVYAAGEWHIRNLLFILTALQEQGLISICDIPISAQDPTMSLINA